MASYKVPQDVEAEDKLIGPFSFRQFIYLIIVAMSIGIAYALAQLFILLVVIPLPVILLFGALALPLRKDQPMEIYLAAMVSFYLKPRRRLWDPDGIESLIEITAPRTVEVQRTKDISQGEAVKRFSYLAEIVDSEGWAVRGVGVQTPNSAMATDVYYAAQQADDVLDDSNSVAQSFDYMITQADARQHEEALAKMRQTASELAAAAQPATSTGPASANPITDAPDPATTSPAPTDQSAPASISNLSALGDDNGQTPLLPTPVAADDNGQSADYNPYPTIQQHVIQPLHDQSEIFGDPAVPPTTPTTSENPVSADIIDLANTTDLSIETIAHEANRLKKKNDGELQEEVIISLH